MSDRVAIIGGSTPARDHFPFAVPDLEAGDVGFDTSFPINVPPLSQMCDAFYRVKRWKIEADVTLNSGDPGERLIQGTYYAVAGGVIDNGSVVIPGYTRESDIVVPRLTSSFESSIASTFQLFFTEESNPYLINGPAPAIGFNGAEFYPSFYFQLDATIGTLDTTEEESGVELAWLVGGGLIWASNLFGRTGQASQYSGNIEISSDEFWPYASKAGLPVYDTATGAPLRDPFS